MKIWVTRQTTGEIHAGGLERLWVWFQKPVFYWRTTPWTEDEIPWSDNGETGLSVGWIGGHLHWLPSGHVSFGKMFGYDDGKHENGVPGLSRFVWRKLNEHYGNTKFVDGWYEYEAAGKCHQKDFLLEIDLSLTWNT